MDFWYTFYIESTDNGKDTILVDQLYMFDGETRGEITLFKVMRT